MTDSVTTNTEETRLTGRVKWFNNQAGYGFLTATVDDSEQDIFVHHSALKTTEDQFRYLVEGEYVSFVTTTNSDNKTTASDVTGAGGGKLMCETRWERKQANTTRKPQDEGSDSGSRPRRNNRERFHGGGPRQTDRVKVVEDEDGNSTVWKLVRSGKGTGGSRGKRSGGGGGGRGRGRRQSRDNQDN